MTHKILKVFIDTKHTDKIIDSSMDSIDIMYMAENEKRVHTFKKGTYFCMYRTQLDDQDGVIMVFTIKLPSTSTSTSGSTDLIMSLVELLEDTFTNLSFKFSRNIEGINKNLAILTAIKKISDLDFL